MQNYFESIKNKNIHIVGLSGAEGSAVAFFLASGGIKNITAHDFSENVDELKRNFWKTHLNLPPLEREKEFKKMLDLPIKINYKNEYLLGVLEADIIFIPSSWFLYKFNFPYLKEAEEKGITMKGITNLYFDLAPCPIISVTGTKGKGTTSKLIYEILKKDREKKGKGKAYLGGNDRAAGQALKDLVKMAKDDVLVLETSNRQLMANLGKSPHIGVITNITPDHIEEHGGFEEYAEVKKKLIKHQKKGDYAVLNYDNETTALFAREFPETVFLFSRKTKLDSGAFVKNGSIFIKYSGKEKKICELCDIKIIGEHNIENVLAAVSAAYLFGVTPEIIKEAVIDFKGLRHRIEFIGEFGGINPVGSIGLFESATSNVGRNPLTLGGQKITENIPRASNGVKFYDDLASTTPESTIAAIKTLQDLRFKNKDLRIILVAGGDTKGGEYGELAKIISEKIDILILLPGTGTEAIKLQINSKIQNTKFHSLPLCKRGIEGDLSASANILEYNDLSEVLKVLKAQTKKGDIVLISPACAYFQSKYIDSTGKSLRKLIIENFVKN